MTRCPCGRDGAGCRVRTASAADAGSRIPCPRAICRACGVVDRGVSGWGDAADQRDQGLAVVEVRRGDADRQSQTTAVHDEVDFRSLLTAAGRIRFGQPPPLRPGR